jgi:hypothetical protein
LEDKGTPFLIKKIVNSGKNSSSTLSDLFIISFS